ncbi:polysaccharide biosynthesis tyrosine autokinase [Curtobacterium sp. MCSS17_007]|uniref:polysaccharide biosynthesis tyrosine autokinase n=1 Tax=Curtobacterium sp. MCSS17_007 TaxID=2175646 RepID=UPI000DA96A9D|nr:polysaccharide biosynthesis tyrosine autokinase [Curtobacterium sp. MCSS17_007]WIE76073.1 polysaccharide biosynthesis tyrosine autokinase [Curtobacterium sp. MCSS17_007]
MTFTDTARMMRRSWLLIICAVLIGIGLGALSVRLQDPVYRADTELFVAIQPTSPDPAELVQGNSAAQQKVASYIEVARSARVLQPVIDELGLRTDVSRLARHVSASSPLNSVLLDISVRDEDPAAARRIAMAVAESFTKVVTEQLEKPTTGGASLVKIEMIEPPVTPTSPESPNVVRRTLLGGATGLVIGLGLALLRFSLDTRVRSVDDVESVADVPVIGAIGFDPTADERPLIVHMDPRNPRAESFRSLRTNVRFLDLDETRRSFTITSALPSEGKSTTAANLAIAMAESGARVMLVDADLRRPRVAEVLGLDGAAGLTDVLIGRAELEDVVIPWGAGGLHVLPAGRIPPNPSELLGSASMRALTTQLIADYDFVVIDAPPLLPVTDAAILSRITGGAVVISAVGRATRKQLRTALDALTSIGARTFGVVLTKVPNKKGTYGYSTYSRYYGDDLSVDETATPKRPGRRAADIDPTQQ